MVPFHWIHPFASSTKFTIAVSYQLSEVSRDYNRKKHSDELHGDFGLSEIGFSVIGRSD